MRIDSLGRATSGPHTARPGAAAGAFHVLEAGPSTASQATSSLRAAPGLDALIALQSIPEETPRERRRREISRGRGLLDALDRMKLGLIDGRDDTTSLAALAARLKEQRSQTGDAGLDDALSAIELRALVEVAKRGR